jgi:flagellar basal body L-ring protein FlgH
MIVESTSGSQQSDVSHNSKGSLSSGGKMGGNLTRFLPLFSASTNFEDKNSGAADAAQKDALNGKVTAIVTEVSPNGNMTLTGKRHLEVNGDSYVLTLQGIARQKDITSENIVLSYNLANVDISYTKDGFMDGVASPFIRRWTSWLLMAGVATSAYFFLGVASN